MDLKLYLFIVLIKSAFTELSIPISTITGISKESEQIIKNILVTNLTPKRRILYASDNDDLNLDYLIANHTKLSYNPKLENYNAFSPFRTNLKINTYLLVLTSNTTTVIDKLKTLKDWNSRANFLIYYAPQQNATDSNIESEKEILESLFTYLNTFFIYNVVVITTSSSTYTYLPYKYENLNDPDLTPVLIQNGDWFPNKLPKHWRNSSAVVVTAAQPPYLDYLDGIQYDGIDYQLMEQVLQPQLGFKHRYLFEFKGFGAIINGTYTFLLDRLFSQEADLALGGIQFMSDYVAFDFEFTYPYISEDIIWYVPTPAVLSHTMNLTRLFSLQVWIILLAIIFGQCILWGIFGTLAPREIPYFKSPWNAGMMPWKFLFSEVSSHIPTRISLKTFYIFTWIYIFMVNTCWEALLISTMTTTNREAPIKSLQDVIDKDLHISITDNMAELMHNTGGTIGKSIYDKNVPVTLFVEIFANFHQIATKKDMVSFGTRGLLKYLEVLGHFRDHGEMGIRTIEETVLHYYVPHIFIKGHPMYEGYNEIMNWIRCSGVSDMYLQHFYHRLSLQRERREGYKVAEMHHILKMEHLSLSFGVLSVGLLISICAFFIEKVFYWQPKNTIKVCY